MAQKLGEQLTNNPEIAVLLQQVPQRYFKNQLDGQSNINEIQWERTGDTLIKTEILQRKWR